MPWASGGCRHLSYRYGITLRRNCKGESNRAASLAPRAGRAVSALPRTATGPRTEGIPPGKRALGAAGGRSRLFAVGPGPSSARRFASLRLGVPGRSTTSGYRFEPARSSPRSSCPSMGGRSLSDSLSGFSARRSAVSPDCLTLHSLSRSLRSSSRSAKTPPMWWPRCAHTWGSPLLVSARAMRRRDGDRDALRPRRRPLADKLGQ